LLTFCLETQKQITPQKVKTEKHVEDEKEYEKHLEPQDFNRIVFPAQHFGNISTEDSARKLKEFWPLDVVKMLTVTNAAPFDTKCGLQHLQIEVFLYPGYSYENFFERPMNDSNWPKAIQDVSVSIQCPNIVQYWQQRFVSKISRFSTNKEIRCHNGGVVWPTTKTELKETRCQCVFDLLSEKIQQFRRWFRT